MLRLLLLRWFAARTLGGVLAGAIGAALPIAVALKLVGVPVLAAVALAGAPIGVVFTVLRLPRLIIGGAVALVGTLAAAAFAIGVLALKVLFVVIAVALVVRLVRAVSRRDRGPIVEGPDPTMPGPGSSGASAMI